jgi:hypothetical protein
MNDSSTLSSGAIVNRNDTRFFYIGASFLLLALAFIGFRLFYLHGYAYPGRPLTPPIRNVVIAHGVSMTAWILLFIVQPLLIVSQKRRMHMVLGKLGAVLAAGMVFLGVWVAVSAAAVNPPELKLWGLVPKQFMAISFFGILMFAGYVAVGVWKRRRPEIHRPMMLLATLAATTAAIDRIAAISNLYAHTIWGQIFGPFFAPVVIGAVFLVVKWALTRSFNRFYAYGYLVMVLAGPVIMKVATTPSWERFADFLIRSLT